MSMMCGGTSETKLVDNDVTTLTTEVKSDLEVNIGMVLNTFEPVSYKSQIVAGTNYFVKVKIGEGDYVHLRIFKPLPGQGKTQLVSHQSGKKEADEIEYF